MFPGSRPPSYAAGNCAAPVSEGLRSRDPSRYPSAEFVVTCGIACASGTGPITPRPREQQPEAERRSVRPPPLANLVLCGA